MMAQAPADPQSGPISEASKNTVPKRPRTPDTHLPYVAARPRQRRRFDPNEPDCKQALQEAGKAVSRGVSIREPADVEMAVAALKPRHAPKQSAVTKRVAPYGKGGGASVPGVDTFAPTSLRVAPFPDTTVAKIKRRNLAPGATCANPVDLPRPVPAGDAGRDTEQFLNPDVEGDKPDAAVLHINMSVDAGLSDPRWRSSLMNLLDADEHARRRHPGAPRFLRGLRSDGRPKLRRRRQISG